MKQGTLEDGSLVVGWLIGCWLVDWLGVVPGSWDAIVGFDHEAAGRNLNHLSWQSVWLAQAVMGWISRFTPALPCQTY
jgi:hypothetical protein